MGARARGRADEPGEIDMDGMTARPAAICRHDGAQGVKFADYTRVHFRESGLLIFFRALGNAVIARENKESMRCLRRDNAQKGTSANIGAKPKNRFYSVLQR